MQPAAPVAAAVAQFLLHTHPVERQREGWLPQVTVRALAPPMLVRQHRHRHWLPQLRLATHWVRCAGLEHTTAPANRDDGR